jgi:hypothetical protein
VALVQDGETTTGATSGADRGGRASGTVALLASPTPLAHGDDATAGAAPALSGGTASRAKAAVLVDAAGVDALLAAHGGGDIDDDRSRVLTRAALRRPTGARATTATAWQPVLPPVGPRR